MNAPDPRYGGSNPSPSQLSRYLRTGSDPDLRRRRWLVGLSLAGVTIGQVVGAYQTGILKHLPDPPVGPFDSDEVDAAEYAYKRASTPDGLIMIVTYALTAWVAGAGGPDRPRHRPFLPLLMAAKVASDVAVDIKLAGEEWQENKALCAWCQAATAISGVSLALALPEARRAWRNLRRR
ncbi:vitamin K epoxide reductase family protein [Blastococcus sp. BMG 814]|uniref:Vitamin K epoxide reductase family protein n=1 Tax=Blastococcus carthaginiensis TaxID=3050034 RepID=A0ABT9IDE8_9ACTN|nr:vitamin K epoxide reductase family protein [Blastococcus carthaginiensis]MDP5183598.1 vitamin K epoxide reductase family protein [Blastococcus carthaginiensis]